MHLVFDPLVEWLPQDHNMLDENPSSSAPILDLSPRAVPPGYQDRFAWDSTGADHSHDPWQSDTLEQRPQTQAMNHAPPPLNGMVSSPYLQQHATIPSNVSFESSSDTGCMFSDAALSSQVNPYAQDMSRQMARKSVAETEASGSDPASPIRTKPGTQRERNRLAAHKCRQKSKINTEELQKQERELAELHRCLTQHVQYLKNEVLDLKNEVLRHGSCDCELIGDYISRAAQGLP